MSTYIKDNFTVLHSLVYLGFVKGGGLDGIINMLQNLYSYLRRTSFHKILKIVNQVTTDFSFSRQYDTHLIHTTI